MVIPEDTLPDHSVVHEVEATEALALAVAVSVAEAVASAVAVSAAEAVASSKTRLRYTASFGSQGPQPLHHKK